jgi:uncharacterized iron-regulated membrane protein
MHPDLFTPRSSGAPADPVAVMESVQKAYPDARVSGIEAPTTMRPTYLAYAVRGDRFITLLLDPVSAELLGEVPEQSFVRTLQNLHFDLLGGSRGRLANGIGSLVLLGMCVTGLVIWWPGRSHWTRSLTVDFSRQWKRVNWDLHSAIGIWSVVLIAMWAATGAYFVFPSLVRRAVNRISPLTQAATPQSTPAHALAAQLTWRALIDGARRRVPEQHVARVVLPSSPASPFLVMFSRARPTPANPELTSVYLDRYTGEAVTVPPPATRSIGDIVMAWLTPLHVGNFGGNGIRIVWLLLGMAPPVLFVTGFTMWWTRVVRVRWLRDRFSISYPSAPEG